MNIVIIEDEDLAAASLEKLLLQSGYNIVIKKRLESVAESIEWFKENSCDLIFSDIHLGDGESFEIFETLKIKIPIIFTTAFDKYAIQSFQFHAIDYLLKPYDSAKLNAAIEKYMSFNEPVAGEFSKIENLLLQLKERNKEIQERFLVSRGEQLLSIKVPRLLILWRKTSIFFYLQKTESVICMKIRFRISSLNYRLKTFLKLIESLLLATMRYSKY